MAGRRKALKDEIARMSALVKNIDSKTDSFKNYISDNMQRCEITKIESDLVSITLRKAGKLVEIVDQDDIADEFLVVVPESSRPDKKAILDELKSGGTVPGCRLIDGKRSLIIK